MMGSLVPDDIGMFQTLSTHRKAKGKPEAANRLGWLTKQVEVSECRRVDKVWSAYPPI
jgi:hypothetical protein